MPVAPEGMRRVVRRQASLLEPSFEHVGVAAARESLTRKQIAAVTGLDAEKELPALLGLTAFVPVREGRYSLFHRSLFEWLTGWDTKQDQAFAGLYHLSLQDGHKRLADWGWAEYERRHHKRAPLLSPSSSNPSRRSQS